MNDLTNDNADLDFLATVAGEQVLRLVNPRDGQELQRNGKPVLLFIRGPNDPVMRDFERATQNRRLKTAQRIGRVNLTAEEIEAETINRLALAITGWENVARGGVEVMYTPEGARGLIRDYSVIRNQVDAFYRDEGNFLMG